MSVSTVCARVAAAAEKSQILSTLTDRYAEPDGERVSALRAAAANIEVGTAASSATVVRAGPGEL